MGADKEVTSEGMAGEQLIIRFYSQSVIEKFAQSCFLDV